MNSKERDQVYVAHMLDHLKRIFEYCENDEKTFRSSRLIQDAVIRNLQTGAESAQQLSDDSKALAPEWHLRSVGYLAVDELGRIGICDGRVSIANTTLGVSRLEGARLGAQYRDTLKRLG